MTCKLCGLDEAVSGCEHCQECLDWGGEDTEYYGQGRRDFRDFDRDEDDTDEDNA